MSGHDYTNLTEDSFNFLYHVEEISGVLRFQNIPTVERIVLPNLHIIRGEELIATAEGRGLALVLLNTRIGAIVLPKLTEITQGDVRLENTTSSMCNYKTVNWNDIIDNGRLDDVLACNTSQSEGEWMTSYSWKAGGIFFELHGSLIYLVYLRVCVCVCTWCNLLKDIYHPISLTDKT